MKASKRERAVALPKAKDWGKDHIKSKIPCGSSKVDRECRGRREPAAGGEGEATLRGETAEASPPRGSGPAVSNPFPPSPVAYERLLPRQLRNVDRTLAFERVIQMFITVQEKKEIPIINPCIFKYQL